jgi:hypothetical protein
MICGLKVEKGRIWINQEMIEPQVSGVRMAHVATHKAIPVGGRPEKYR